MRLKSALVVASTRLAQRLWATCLERRIITYGDTEVLAAATGGAAWDAYWARFVREFPDRFFFAPRNRKEFFLQALLSMDGYEDILERARDLTEGTFAFLGSGPVHLPHPLPWHTDFTTGAAWSATFYTRLKRTNEQPGDMKIPWELGRFQVLPWLGSAFWVSGSRRFSEEFCALIDDWITANPMGIGVQWANAMEVAIRACNWIAGMAFFLEDASIPAAFWQRCIGALWRHGEYIEDNLEITRRSGNHLIADLTGLVMLGSVFDGTIAGRRWFSEGVRGMTRELLRQTSVDGVDYEKSLAYHRFVAEMGLAVMLLCRRRGRPLSAAVEERLERMCAVSMYCTRPDGSVANLGDNDDGRLFRFRSGDEALTHRGLLATAAVAFDRADFKAAAGAPTPDVLFLTGAEGWERFNALPPTDPPGSVHIIEGGLVVMRAHDVHVTVDVGELGKHGWGGHGHNDTLAFELWWNRPIVVDPGTFVYTGDPQARDRFRSARAHNAPVIDDLEIAPFVGPFKVRADRTRPCVLEWRTTAERDVLVATHDAYMRLADPVRIRRKVVLEKSGPALVVEDTIVCGAGHTVDLKYTLAPGLAVEQLDATHVRIGGAGNALVLSTSHPVSVVSGEYSPSYGVRTDTFTLVCVADIVGTAIVTWSFTRIT